MKRDESLKRDESSKREERTNSSEQETGATNNRGVSIESSDDQVKEKKVSSTNVDEQANEKEGKYCESEGDADQDIISDDDDDGVDPNAYGDEDGSETEVESEAPPKKKEYFKRKPTVY